MLGAAGDHDAVGGDVDAVLGAELPCGGLAQIIKARLRRILRVVVGNGAAAGLLDVVGRRVVRLADAQVDDSGERNRS